MSHPITQINQINQIPYPSFVHHNIEREKIEHQHHSLEEQEFINERKRTYENDYLTHGVQDLFDNHRPGLPEALREQEPEPKRSKVGMDSILNQLNRHDLAFNFSQPKDSSGIMQLNLEHKDQMIDTGIPLPSHEPKIYLCQWCGQDFRSASQRRKHYKENHSQEVNGKKKASGAQGGGGEELAEGYDVAGPANLPKPMPIDNSLRTVFGMTQIKKMPGEVRDKRLRIQTLEKRILPKMVEWWGNNPKLLIADLLQTDFLRDALQEYLRRERY